MGTECPRNDSASRWWGVGDAASYARRRGAVTPPYGRNTGDFSANRKK